MTGRRVITGVGADGKSRVIADAPIPAAGEGGVGVVNLWSHPAIPADNAAPLEAGSPAFAFEQLFGAGYAFMYAEYAPGLGRDDPGMHATPTADHMVVIEGECVLVLEDGEVTLRAGDTCVVRGVRHGWRNDTDRVCRLVSLHLPGTGGQQ